MRGSERLVEEYSWMRGICSRLYHSTKKSETFRYRCPSSVFFDNRFRSADCQKIQLPLGGSQGVEDLRFYHSTNGCVPSRSGGKSAPTGAVETMRLQQPTEYTPSVSPFGLTAFNHGMIATGNHNFERFAALCNTPEVEPRAAAPQAGGFYPPLQRRTPNSGAPATFSRQNK